jgi:hypothetical protein
MHGALPLDAFAADAPAGPAWVAITLAIVAVLGTVATAFGPALVEWIKRSRNDASPGPKTLAPAADSALALVDEAIDDLKADRDYWRKRAEECADRALANAVIIAKLEARVETVQGERDRLIDRFGRRETG